MASERKRKNRTGGLLFGVLGGVSAVLLLDLVHLHILSGQGFSGQSAVVWVAVLFCAVAAAALFLPAVAALASVTTALAGRLGRLRLGRHRPALARSVAVGLMGTPLVALFSWTLFQGRGVARMPVVAMLGPVVATVIISFAVIAAWLVVERISRARPLGRALGGLFGAAVVGALFFADARLFVGLYDFIHTALAVAVIGGSVVVSRALWPERAGPGPSTTKGKLILVVASLSICVGALMVCVTLLRSAPQARADLFERTIYASRGLGLVARIVPLAEAPPLEADALSVEEIEESYLGPRRLIETPDRRPDILLFSIDAVNTNRFPGRGYEREVMPNIEKLLPLSVRFEHAYTTVPETQYALPGIVMSTTRDLGPAAAVRESGATIASELRRVGYGTHWVYEARDLFQGGGVLNNLEFEGFDGRYGIEDDRPYGASERVIEILDRSVGTPVFVWTHIFAPHMPYDPPEQFDVFGRTRSDKYDGELLTADAYVGRVLDHLRERGRLDQTIVVITADHGEWSGEGGRFGHGADVLERTVNVPLLFTGPGIDQGRVVEDAVSILDLGPTLLELGGAPSPDSFEGESIASALSGGELRHGMVVSFTEGRGSTAAYIDGYKLVFNRDRTVVRLYNLGLDREAERDVAGAEPERVRRMLAQVTALDVERVVAERVAESDVDSALAHYRAEAARRDASPAERAVAASALGHLESDGAATAALELLGRAEAPRPVRHRLAESLARLGARGNEEAAFRIALDDEDLVVRVFALRSLRGTAMATRAVEELSARRDVHLRRGAASILEGGRARPDATSSARLLDDEDPLVRTLAYRGLDRLSVRDRSAVLLRGIGDEAPLVRLAAAGRCGDAPSGGCVEAVLRAVEAHEDDTATVMALLSAVAPALERTPELWAGLVDGPPAQRALAYEGLSSSERFDSLLLERLDAESDDRAREALIRAVGRRGIREAATALVRQHGGSNFALGRAATDALLEIGPLEEDVPEILSVFPRVEQMQTKVNLLHVLGAMPSISDGRVFDLAERMRATPMKDHHLIRALVEVYSRLEDPRGERFRIDHPMYTNFGYQFWLYGYSLTPSQPAPGDEVHLRMVWSIRWNQQQGTSNFIHLVGGRRQIPMNRREVAGRRLDQWPRCRIMVDEVTFEVPEEASRLQVLTGWVRGRRGRLPVVYGDHDDENRAVVVDIPLRIPSP